MDSKDQKKILKKDKRQAIEGGIKATVVSIIIHYFYYLIILIIIFTFTLGYFILLKPKIDALVKQKEITEAINQEYSEKLARDDERIKELKKILSIYDQLKEEDIEKINNILPKEIEREKLFIQINNIVKSNGLILDSLKLGGEERKTKKVKKRGARASEEDEEAKKYEDESKASGVEISLEVRGVSYLALKSLLNSLENNLRLLDVQFLNYSPTGMSAGLSLKTYYLK